MHTVTSLDGTRIAYWRQGEGPPLVLVHGATADHTTTWRAVMPHLERRFTVYAMDRRGRGGSGDAPAYALEREVEDVAAVVAAIGEPTRLLGHSFGALCALEAALLGPRPSRLILYEGVPLRGEETYPPGVVDRLEALLRQGDVEGTLVAIYRDLAAMSHEEIELLRAQPAWATRLGNAPSTPREMKALARYNFQPERFRELRVPTLLLVGGESRALDHDNAEGVARALPDASVVVLPGQKHVAMHTASELFVREIVRFLEA